ncbi:MAG: peptide deformylase [Candidatus Eisenbacteria bacterium]|nr:peptide deformylase [Candidatus Eisenbacteria bacterium]
MPAQTIVELGNSYLLEHCQPVEEPSSASVSSLINDLRDTLESFRAEHGFGQGIAAPQIAVLSRVVYIDMASGHFRGAMINPEIVSESEGSIDLWDSCFSFPNLLARVRRAVSVRVQYLDENGKLEVIEATNELATLLQHEIDHLDGILAVERAISPKAFMTRDEWERQGRPL